MGAATRADRPARVARALAGAFLAGDWLPEAMGRRGKRCLRDRRRWLADLAQVVFRAYPERPADRPRELAEFIAATELFAAACRDPDRRPQVHVWMGAATEMGPVSGAAPEWLLTRRPAIPTVAALAAWLGVTERHLDWFADRRSLEGHVEHERLRHYRRRWVRKPDGSLRLLEAPKRETKDLQRQVLHQILDLVEPGPAAHGFRRGRSVYTAAQPHVGREVVARFDLEAFFASVTAGRVYGIFRWIGYPEPVAHALAALCTTVTPVGVLRDAPAVRRADQIERRRRLLDRLAAPHLAQGSPTSPGLANLCAYRLDRRMARLATRFGATYTRYADDLFFSGPRALLHSADRLRRLVETIAGDEGFRLHSGKSAAITAAQRQTVAGLVVNHRTNVARPTYDRLRAVLHDAARSGPEAANRHGHQDFRAHLRGMISWVGAANPPRAAKLDRAFAAITWPD